MGLRQLDVLIPAHKVRPSQFCKIPLFHVIFSILCVLLFHSSSSIDRSFPVADINSAPATSTYVVLFGGVVGVVAAAPVVPASTPSTSTSSSSSSSAATDGLNAWPTTTGGGSSTAVAAAGAPAVLVQPTAARNPVFSSPQAQEEGGHRGYYYTSSTSGENDGITSGGPPVFSAAGDAAALVLPVTSPYLPGDGTAQHAATPYSNLPTERLLQPHDPNLPTQRFLGEPPPLVLAEVGLRTACYLPEEHGQRDEQQLPAGGTTASTAICAVGAARSCEVGQQDSSFQQRRVVDPALDVTQPVPPILPYPHAGSNESTPRTSAARDVGGFTAVTSSTRPTVKAEAAGPLPPPPGVVVQQLGSVSSVGGDATGCAPGKGPSRGPQAEENQETHRAADEDRTGVGVDDAADRRDVSLSEAAPPAQISILRPRSSSATDQQQEAALLRQHQQQATHLHRSTSAESTDFFQLSSESGGDSGSPNNLRKSGSSLVSLQCRDTEEEMQGRRIANLLGAAAAIGCSGVVDVPPGGTGGTAPAVVVPLDVDHGASSSTRTAGLASSTAAPSVAPVLVPENHDSGRNLHAGHPQISQCQTQFVGGASCSTSSPQLVVSATVAAPVDVSSQQENHQAKTRETMISSAAAGQGCSEQPQTNQEEELESQQQQLLLTELRDFAQETARRLDLILQRASAASAAQTGGGSTGSSGFVVTRQNLGMVGGGGAGRRDSGNDLQRGDPASASLRAAAVAPSSSSTRAATSGATPELHGNRNSSFAARAAPGPASATSSSSSHHAGALPPPPQQTVRRPSQQAADPPRQLRPTKSDVPPPKRMQTTGSLDNSLRRVELEAAARTAREGGNEAAYFRQRMMVANCAARAGGGAVARGGGEQQQIGAGAAPTSPFQQARTTSRGAAAADPTTGNATADTSRVNADVASHAAASSSTTGSATATRAGNVSGTTHAGVDIDTSTAGQPHSPVEQPESRTRSRAENHQHIVNSIRRMSSCDNVALTNRLRLQERNQSLLAREQELQLREQAVRELELEQQLENERRAAAAAQVEYDDLQNTRMGLSNQVNQQGRQLLTRTASASSPSATNQNQSRRLVRPHTTRTTKSAWAVGVGSPGRQLARAPLSISASATSLHDNYARRGAGVATQQNVVDHQNGSSATNMPAASASGCGPSHANVRRSAGAWPPASPLGAVQQLNAMSDHGGVEQMIMSASAGDEHLQYAPECATVPVGFNAPLLSTTLLAPQQPPQVAAVPQPGGLLELGTPNMQVGAGASVAASCGSPPNSPSCTTRAVGAGSLMNLPNFSTCFPGACGAAGGGSSMRFSCTNYTGTTTTPCTTASSVVRQHSASPILQQVQQQPSPSIGPPVNAQGRVISRNRSPDNSSVGAIAAAASASTTGVTRRATSPVQAQAMLQQQLLHQQHQGTFLGPGPAQNLQPVLPGCSTTSLPPAASTAGAPASPPLLPYHRSPPLVHTGSQPYQVVRGFVVPTGGNANIVFSSTAQQQQQQLVSSGAGTGHTGGGPQPAGAAAGPPGAGFGRACSPPASPFLPHRNLNM
ncbi:unnamed protein product [Amoebophrya sp. A120]|nr:unnamed protein product [Amoebophrya sp. A120]|eukprot:GSA120T00022408001.1